MSEYVSLHTHSEHSELDSTAKIVDLFAAAARMGQSALAITDHGTLSGMWKAQKAADATGVKLIPGLEAYLAFGSRFERNTITVPADDMDVEDRDDATGRETIKRYQHLTLLATSPTGWQNLVRIANASYETVWGKYPRIDYTLLAEHAEDIIVLTGCLGGPVLGPLSRGDETAAREGIEAMIRAVGADNVYVEVMEHGIERESAILPAAARLAGEYGLRLAATNDSHHVAADGSHVHDAWLAVRTKAKLADPSRYRFTGDGYHHRDETEMRALRPEAWWQEAVTETSRIAARVAQRCLPTPSPKLPKFPTPVPFSGNLRYLHYLVSRGATERYGDLALRPDVRERLNAELAVVRNPNHSLRQQYPDGFVDYFLITHDLVSWAKTNDILVGPGRGSAAGSLIAYCLGITGICPLENGLLFERFLEQGRPDFPDIDIDFEAERRDDLLNHLEDVWGKRGVSLIGSFASSKTKRAIKDAARVLDATRIGDTLAKLVPVEFGQPYSFDQLFDTQIAASAEFRGAVDKHGEIALEVCELARGFANTVAGTGIHACGVIVSDLDLTDLIPQRIDSNTGRRVSAWDSKDVESLGLLKMDVLALRNLDVAAKALEFIHDTTGLTLTVEEIPHPNTQGDPRVDATWRLLREGRTAGVFQMESPKMAELSRAVGPDRISDLSAVIALYRPGPLSAGMDRLFADRKNGGAVDYSQFTSDPEETRLLDSVLGETYGSLVYQEQLMRLAGVICGFNSAERGRLRKAVGKKNADEMAAVGELFLSRAVIENRDADGTLLAPAFAPETATRLWDAFKGSGQYLFNASHSAAYAQLAYVTAYLKANWPAAYGAAILAVTKSDDKRVEALRALQSEGIEVLGPDVNRSLAHSAPEADGVRLGLAEVKGVGQAGERIVEVREATGLTFTSLAHLVDLVRRGGTNDAGEVDLGYLPANHLEALIEAGAFDEFGPRYGQYMLARIAKDAPELPIPNLEWGFLERSARARRRLLTNLDEHPLVRLQDVVRSWSKPGPINALTGEAFYSPAIPIAAIPDQAGSVVTIIGLLSRWSEKAYSGGRLASLTLEGSTSAIDAVMWDATLQEARAANLIPPIGGLTAASGRVVIREFESEDDEGNITVDTLKELVIDRLYAVPVDDPLTGSLPASTIPTFQFVLDGADEIDLPAKADAAPANLVTATPETVPTEPTHPSTQTPEEPAGDLPATFQVSPGTTAARAAARLPLSEEARRAVRLGRTSPKWLPHHSMTGANIDVLDPAGQVIARIQFA